MNGLEIKNTQTLDSREVAEMIGKRHDHLVRDIEKYIEYLENPILGNGLEPIISEFFIKGSYQAEKNGRLYKKYDCTRKGCELIAHKLTGEKGTIFTAKYINRFHEMQQSIKIKQLSVYKPKMTSVGEVASLIKVLRASMKDQDSPPSDITKMEKIICEQFNIELPETFVKKPTFVQVSMFFSLE